MWMMYLSLCKAFSEKIDILVLPTGVKPMTFPLLVWALYTTEVWETREARPLENG